MPFVRQARIGHADPKRLELCGERQPWCGVSLLAGDRCRIIVAEGIIIAATSCGVAVVPALVLMAFLGAGLGNLFFAAALPYRISVLGADIWLASRS